MTKINSMIQMTGLGGLLPGVIDDHLDRIESPIRSTMPLPDRSDIRGGNEYSGIREMPLPDMGGNKFPDNRILPRLPGPYMPHMPMPMPIRKDPDYQTQFNSFSETLGGFGEQMGGFGEQMGGFGKQMGGFDKQFGGIMDRLSKIEEGIAGLMPQGAGAGGGTVPYGNSPATPTTPSSPLDGGVFSVYKGSNARGF